MRSMVEGQGRNGPSVRGLASATSPLLRNREEQGKANHPAQAGIRQKVFTRRREGTKRDFRYAISSCLRVFA